MVISSKFDSNKPNKSKLVICKAFFINKNKNNMKKKRKSKEKKDEALGSLHWRHVVARRCIVVMVMSQQRIRGLRLSLN